MFVDRARFVVQAGRGGDGVISFRHESGAPRGGPDGGDGGDGGDVLLRATKARPTLADVAHRPVFKAEDGRRGMGRNKAGRMGRDLILAVPVGTVVREGEDEEGPIVADLTTDGQEFLLAHGGNGGFGNVHFATAINQTPRVARRGAPGERKTYTLELKLLAQVGLVGLPNAGKSTFLRRVSRARPKVGAYPFTTLRPHLGVAELSDGRKLVLADLPGLIEGAHQGVGLGDEFLRHVERCRVILHLVDGTAGPDAGTPSPAEAYKVIRAELLAYDERLAGKPEVVALNKVDALARDRIDAVAAELEEACGRSVHRISGVAGTGIDTVLTELERHVVAAEAADEPLVPVPEQVPPHRLYDFDEEEEEPEGGPPALD
jgi:GTP-binding protein